MCTQLSIYLLINIYLFLLVGENGSGSAKGGVRSSRGPVKLAGAPRNGVKGSSNIPGPHKVT